MPELLLPRAPRIWTPGCGAPPLPAPPARRPRRERRFNPGFGFGLGSRSMKRASQAQGTGTIVSLDSAVGDQGGGSFHTLTGTGLVSGGSLAVSIGGTAATSVTFVNATTLTFKAPAKATGTYDVVVTNGDGTLTNTLTSGYEAWNPGDTHSMGGWWQGPNYSSPTWSGRASAGGSGSRHLTQAGTVVAGPTLNDRATVNFDGTDDTFTNDVSWSSSDVNSTTRRWGWAVFMVDAITTDAGISSAYDNDAIWASGGGNTGLHLKSTGTFLQNYHFVATGEGNSTAITTAAWYLALFYYDGTNLGLSINGGASFSTTASSTSGTVGTDHLVGRNYTSSQFFDGKMADHGMSNTAVPNSTAFQKIASFMKSYWALTTF